MSFTKVNSILVVGLLAAVLNVGVWYTVTPTAQASEAAEAGESTDGIPGRTVGGGTRLNVY